MLLWSNLLTVITLNGFMLNIEKYDQAKATGKKATAWLNIKPKITRAIIPRRIFGDDDEAPNHPLEALQKEHEANKEMLRALLENQPRWSDAVLRAKQITADPRKMLEQSQQQEQGQRSVSARILSLPRKIGKATRKLDKALYEREE